MGLVSDAEHEEIRRWQSAPPGRAYARLWSDATSVKIPDYGALCDTALPGHRSHLLRASA